MNKKMILALLVLLSGLISFAQDKPKDKVPTPPDLKERIQMWEERIQNLETRNKAETELREQALTEAKKEIANAKKFLDQGKKQDAHSALVKARHHALRINDLGKARMHRMPPRFRRPMHCDCWEPPFGPGFGPRFGPPPWSGERHPFGYGPWWLDKDLPDIDDD